MIKTQNMIEKPKVKVYIDGANMFYAQKHLGWNLDWGKIKDFLEKNKGIKTAPRLSEAFCKTIISLAD